MSYVDRRIAMYHRQEYLLLTAPTAEGTLRSGGIMQSDHEQPSRDRLDLTAGLIVVVIIIAAIATAMVWG